MTDQDIYLLFSDQFRTLDDNLDDLCKRSENYSQTTQIIDAWKQANLNYLQARNKAFSGNLSQIDDLINDFAQAQAEIKKSLQQLQQGVSAIGQVSNLITSAVGKGTKLVQVV